MFRVCASLSDHELYNSCWLRDCDHQPASAEAAVLQLTAWYRQKLGSLWDVASWPHGQCLYVCQHVQEVSSITKLSSSLWDFLHNAARHAASFMRPREEQGAAAGPCHGYGAQQEQVKVICFWVCHMVQALSKVMPLASREANPTTSMSSALAVAGSRLPAILGYLLQLQDESISDTGPDAKDVNKLIYQTAVTLMAAAGGGGRGGRTVSTSGLVLRSFQQELSGLLAQWACFCCRTGGDWGQRQLEAFCRDIVSMVTTRGEQPNIVMASLEYLVECDTIAEGTSPAPAGVLVCSLLISGSLQPQQGTNSAKEQLEEGSALLQMLASVVQRTSQGPAAGRLVAAALIPQVAHHILSDKPANRKAALAIAAAAAQVMPAHGSGHTAAAAAAATASRHAVELLLAASADRDAGVRVRALGHLQDITSNISVRSHEAVAQQVLAAANSSLSDKSKLVRLKALQLLSTLYCHLPGDTTEAAWWQQQLAHAAGTVIQQLAGLLEARPDTPVCCPDTRAAALDLLQVLPARLQAGDVLQLVWGTELPVAVAGQLMSHLHTISPPQHVLQLWLLFLIRQAPVSVAQLVRLQPAVAAAAAGCSCKVRHACMQQLCRALACADPGASAPHAAAAVQVLLLYGGLSTDSLGDAAGEAAVLLDVVPLLLLSCPSAVDAALVLLHGAVVAVQATGAAAVDEGDGGGQQCSRQLMCLVLQGMTRLLPNLGSTDHIDKALQVVCACCCTMPAAAMQLLVNLQAAVTSPSGSKSSPAGAADDQQPAVRFILMLRHMAAMYVYEHKRFLEQLQLAGTAPAAGSSGGVTVEQQREDYMLNEQLRRQHEEAAQAYLDDLMSSSAPACYLPLLLQLVASPAVVLPLRVLALEAVTAIITLTGKLTQEHHMMVAELLQQPSTPGPLLLAAISASQAMVHAWPSHAAPLVQLLEDRLQQCSLAAAESQQQQQQQQQPCNSMDPDALPALQPPGDQDDQDGCVMLALAGAYARLLHADKLPWAAPNCAVVALVLVAAGSDGSQQETNKVQTASASCAGASGIGIAARHAASIMRELLLGVLCSPGHHNRRAALLLSLFSSCPPWGRLQLVQELLLPLLTPSELAAPQLVLPVLRSMLVVDAASSGAAVGAAALLASMTPNAEAMEVLASYLQAHPETAARYTADVRAGLRAFVSNLPARLLSGPSEDTTAVDDEAAGPKTAATAAGRKKQRTGSASAGKGRAGAAAAAREVQGRVLQLLKAPGASAGQQRGKRYRPAACVAGTPGHRNRRGGMLVSPAAAADGTLGGVRPAAVDHAGSGGLQADVDDVKAYELELAAFLRL